MELKIRSWNDMTIRDYMDLMEIVNDKDANPEDIEIAIVGLLCGEDEEKIMDLPVTEFQQLRYKAQFISKFPNVLPRSPKKIVINGKKYSFVKKVQNMSTAQYIDFQTYYKLGIDNYLPQILSCFLIPEGEAYGKSDYDTIIRDIEQLSVVEGLSWSFFMLNQYLNLIRGTVNYSISQIRKSKMENKREMIRRLKAIRSALNGRG